MLPKVSPYKPKPTLHKIYKTQNNSVKWSKEKLKSPHKQSQAAIVLPWHYFHLVIHLGTVFKTWPCSPSLGPSLRAQPLELLTWHSAQSRGTVLLLMEEVSASLLPSPTQVPKPSPPFWLPGGDLHHSADCWWLNQCSCRVETSGGRWREIMKSVRNLINTTKKEKWFVTTRTQQPTTPTQC